MSVNTSTTDNRANGLLTSDQIEKLFQLYEDPSAWADYFIATSVRADAPEALKTELRLNFPYADYLRRTIKRLAMSLPSFTWEAKKGAKVSEQALKKANDICGRRYWEGDKDIWGALNSWREFLFVGGDLFVKMDKPEKELVPERMAAQDCLIMISRKSRKSIDGFRFTYETGSGSFDEGNSGNTVTEEYTKEKWTRTGGDGEDKQVDLKYDFIPVAHMAWEEREGHPRGLPLAERLVKIILHVYMVTYGRRMANKLSSFPINVLSNSTTAMTSTYPGMLLEIRDKSPQSPAKFEVVGGSGSASSNDTEREDALRELSKAAFLPFDEKEAAGGSLDPASGVALEKLSAPQVAYRIQYLEMERSFLEELIYQAMVIEDTPIERGSITPKYDGFSEDARLLHEKAKTMFTEGFRREALRLLGYETEQIEKLMQEKSEDAQDAMTSIFGGGGEKPFGVKKDDEEKPEDEDKEDSKPGEKAGDDDAE